MIFDIYIFDLCSVCFWKGNKVQFDDSDYEGTSKRGVFEKIAKGLFDEAS